MSLPLHERAAAFLNSAEGRAMISRRVAHYRLPADTADDLTQEAVIRALRAETRGVEPDNVEAFMTTLVQRAARDLLRGHLRRPEGHLAGAPDTDGGWDLANDTDDADDPAELLVTAEQLAALTQRVDATRDHLAARLASRPYPAAGALAVLAIVHGDAVPAEDCPTPAGGVAPEEAVWWAGVFYGGPDGCFASAHTPDTAALRKRRSRALTATKATLAEAVVAETMP